MPGEANGTNGKVSNWLAKKMLKTVSRVLGTSGYRLRKDMPLVRTESKQKQKTKAPLKIPAVPMNRDRKWAHFCGSVNGRADQKKAPGEAFHQGP
jgi:hypothetical protein